VIVVVVLVLRLIIPVVTPAFKLLSIVEKAVPLTRFTKSNAGTTKTSDESFVTVIVLLIGSKPGISALITKVKGFDAVGLACALKAKGIMPCDTLKSVPPVPI